MVTEEVYLTRKEQYKRLIFLLIYIYLFLLSIKLIGTSMKMMGSGVAKEIIRTTSSPFTGFFIGVLATSLIQSSSATTSMVVAFVGGDVLTLSSAIPIVMGANIGTSITNTLVSLAYIVKKEEFEKAFSAAVIHDFFNLLTAAVVLPLQIKTNFIGILALKATDVFAEVGGATFTSPLDIVVKPVENFATGILPPSFLLVLSLVVLFLSLKHLVESARYLFARQMDSVVGTKIFASAGVAFIVGMFITALVQSSSATTSIIIPLCGAGILSLEQVLPYMIGANVGTTITAVLAALVFPTTIPMAVAFSHFIFNWCGVLIWYPLRFVPLKMARGFAQVAVRRRYMAILYIIVMFYFIPALLILFG